MELIGDFPQRAIRGLQMYLQNTLLGCLLENFKTLKLTPQLRTSKLIHLCNNVWTQYSLDNGSKWPHNGTPNSSVSRIFTITARSLVNGKRLFMPKHSYAQIFIYLSVFCFPWHPAEVTCVPGTGWSVQQVSPSLRCPACSCPVSHFQTLLCSVPQA